MTTQPIPATAELTPKEIERMDMLRASAADVREQLHAGVTPSRKDLLTLINRADALLWQLHKRRDMEANP